MVDTILFNTPVSSPLHPQLNLPLLKGFLEGHGYSVRVIDSNIEFFHSFLGEIPRLSAERFEQNPLAILSYYNDLEARLWEKSKQYEGLQVGLRSLAMKHDRLSCDSVLAATEDRAANPFIGFYEDLVRRELADSGVRIVGVAVTFQDQVIPAYTLAAVLRRMMPDVMIVLGGQMITRCHDSIVLHPGIAALSDFLVLWDGEVPMLNVHERVLRGAAADMTNVIVMRETTHVVERQGASLRGEEIPSADFADFDLDLYLLPELLIPFQTTRGCYAECAFCAIPFGSNRYRVRTAEKVVDDLLKTADHVRDRYGREARYFKFMEDTSAPGLLHDLAVEIERRDLPVRWETFARLEKAFAKPGFLEQLYRGGCRKIHWGLETNDPDILRNMNKKVSVSYTDEVLRLSAEAGIMNFCFVLIGFPGETDEQRQALTDYIIGNESIHTLTLATFDLTRNSPMERSFRPDNEYKLDCVPAKDFQVRLPYLVDGRNWKEKIVPAAHRMMLEIMRRRPDIGFVTLFPDQIRAMLTDRFGNDWGRTFVRRYGEANIREMLLSTERYAAAYSEKREIDPAALPEPLRREHFRTKEDMALLAKAVLQRREYEKRRIEQV